MVVMVHFQEAIDETQGLIFAELGFYKFTQWCRSTEIELLALLLAFPVALHPLSEQFKSRSQCLMKYPSSLV
jgi:hypothetical protein